MIVDLTRMKVGESATIVSLDGGRNFVLRLQSLGISPGKRITKVSAHFWRGPITVRVGGPNVALGFGMAAKIMVEVDRKGHG